MRTTARNRRVCAPLLLLLLSALGVGLPASRAQEARPTVVEPGELTKRPDLVGRLIEVDDRLRFVQFHPGSGFDQILIKRAPDVTFELPPALRKKQEPRAAAVKIRGTLRRDGDRWWCDVSSVEFLPSDLDRLNRALALLAKSDTDARAAWATWAEKRGKEFGDQALLKRSREIEGEVIRSEAERPTSRNTPEHWLTLADRARARRVAEPEPSALAHRGFRLALAASRSADDLKTVLSRIEAFFPDASKVPDGPAGASENVDPKAADELYRKSGPGGRRALDHRLWADATEQLLERRAAHDPKSLIDLAGEAARLLPDRPALAGKLLARGVEAASADVGSLRQSEVDALAKLYRESLHEPEKARALYRAWLDDQRDRRISPRDAEGRIALAEQYETLLSDRAAAVSLLRDAWKIDPQSREVADAFRRRGFRKVNDEWTDPAKSKAAPGPTPVAVRGTADDAAPGPDANPQPPDTTPPPRGASDSLRNATPEMVRARFGGKPFHKSFLASQGQVVEQWLYVSPRKIHYINILHKMGEPQPRVVSFYTLDRTPSDPQPSP